jgi:predicted RNase H-like HicB family nuclease
MPEITFQIASCVETGGYVARWDGAPGTGGITTQGETIEELQTMIADAVGAYFEPAQRPERVRLHFLEDPVVALAK